MNPEAANESGDRNREQTGSSSPEPARSREEPPADVPAKRSLLHRPWFVILAAVVLVGVLAFGTWYLLGSMGKESTDDAFVDAHVTQVSAKVAGRITKVNVDDNQRVEANALLIELDPRDFEAVVQQQQAAVQSASANRDAAQRSLAQAQARLVTLDADIAAARADVASASADAERNQKDLVRSKQLVTGGAISKQEYDHAVTAAESQNAMVEAAQKRVSATEAQLVEGKDAVASAEAQIQAAEATIKQAQAVLAGAELNLSYMRIVAPQAGRVTNRSVERGNYVQVGQSLLAIVPTEQWVTANFKETQLREMRPGQPAVIEFDAYPGRKVRGHVDSIQRGSGAQFSLLPPENATGNYVKVVQRVPVKILFDEQHPSPLGPGMSVTPTVFVHDNPRRGQIVAGVGLITALLGALVARRLLRSRAPSQA